MKNIDREMMTAVAQGDADAFADLYDVFAPRLLGLIANVLGSRQDAEDVLQEVFGEVWSRADRYNPNLGSPELWLIIVARSRAIDHLRRTRSTAAAESAARNIRRQVAEPEGNRGSQAPGDFSTMADAAKNGLNLLPSEQNDVVCLAFFRGLTCRQIADLRNVPVGTVKTRIRLGLRKLREHFEPRRETYS